MPSLRPEQLRRLDENAWKERLEQQGAQDAREGKQPVSTNADYMRGYRRPRK